MTPGCPSYGEQASYGHCSLKNTVQGFLPVPCPLQSLSWSLRWFNQHWILSFTGHFCRPVNLNEKGEILTLK